MMISDLTAQEVHSAKSVLIEEICSKIVEAFKGEGISDSSSSFLLDHAQTIHSRISDPLLGKKMSVVR